MEQQKGKQRYHTLHGQQQLQEQQQVVSKNNVCIHCGTINEPEALFCENCGESLKEVATLCPNCGKPLNVEADFCESCKTYVCAHRCSFCGVEISEDDRFCPECGEPREGKDCPICRRRSRFSFCPTCSIPLTEEAARQSELAHQEPEWKQMSALVSELEHLIHVVPIEDSKQAVQNEKNEELCRRVRELLGKKYEEEYTPVTLQIDSVSLQEQIAFKRKELQQLLEQTQVQTQENENPVLTRNYIMARKPETTLLGWECNFKHVVHSSPCGCSCPQMGGKWVVLNKDTKVEDDFNLNSVE